MRGPRPVGKFEGMNIDLSGRTALVTGSTQGIRRDVRGVAADVADPPTAPPPSSTGCRTSTSS